MIEDIKADARARMGKSVEAFQNDLSKLRTGRAHTSLLDHVTVDYYGSEVPLNQVASISVGDARTLVVQPWEKKMVPQAEKAILNADLGLNPVTAGDVMRVPLPALTEERRRDMTRIVRQEAENARIAIRNIRRDANSDLKELEKEKEIAKDDERRAEGEIQKLTDEFIVRIEDVLKAKETELMEV
ncbi:MAG: ribosome recycling factor [Gammaproteobacteria bacterium]|nr:ribosome recycling factor [Gammaproteobacteria bacterium]